MTKQNLSLALAAMLTLGLGALTACDSKKEEKKEETAKSGDPKKEEAGGTTGAAAEPAEPAIELPALTDADVGDWGIAIGLPEGAAVGEVDAGDKEMGMPDSVTLSTEKACGYDIELSRYGTDVLDSMYESSKKTSDGLEDVEYLTDEKTETGYTIHYKGKAPLGDMYGMSRGLVVGDKLVLCDAGLSRFEREEAACLLHLCKSIKPKG